MKISEAPLKEKLSRNVKTYILNISQVFKILDVLDYIDCQKGR